MYQARSDNATYNMINLGAAVLEIVLCFWKTSTVLWKANKKQNLEKDNFQSCLKW